MKDAYWLFLLALAVGWGLASQAGVNAQLRTALATPIQAAFISFVIGTCILGALLLWQNAPWPTPATLLQVPWWAWLGGCLGAFNIAISIYLAPQLGAMALAISLVCGQVLASLIYDHYGLAGYPKLPLSPTRVLGALLLVVGVVLVAKK